MARGLQYLRSFSSSIDVGKYPLDGDDVYALVQNYLTLPASEKKFESHKKYLDIQYMAEGEEIIQYAPLAQLTVETPYTAKDDYALYKEPTSSTSLLLPAKSFAIFYPDDGHKPGCCIAGSIAVKKVVVKVKI